MQHSIANIFTTFLLFFIGLIRSASAEAIQLDPSDTTAAISAAPYAAYFRDPSHELPFETVAERFAAGAFEPVGPVIDFGDQDATFWVSFTLKNTGPVAETWILNTGSQRMRAAELHIVRGGAATSQLLDDFRRPFSERPIPYRLLISELSLAPGEEVRVFYSYRSFKSSFFPVKVMSEDAFRAQDKAQLFWTMIIAGTILMFAIYSIFLFFSLEDVAVIFYIFFILATTTYILHQLGFTYAHLWPDAPVFNSRAAVFLGFLSNVFGALYGRYFFANTGQRRMLSAVYDLLIGLSILGVIVSFYVGDHASHHLGSAGFLLVGFVSLLNLLSAILSFRKGDVSAGVAGLGWAVIILWNVFINALSFDMMRVPQQVIFDNFHIYTGFTMMLETMFLTLALFVRVRLIIRANNRERAEYIRLLEQEAESNRAIAQALRGKRAAEEDAARKGRLMESIAHDIRQPLHAMKFFSSAPRARDLSAAAAPLSPAYEAAAMIEDILAAASDESSFNADAVGIQPEALRLNRVFIPVSLVFASQAHEKGLTLNVVPSSAAIYFDRRILVRLLNNLVSNAIRYTDKGKILVGCRRRPGAIEIQVIDTGCGVSPDAIAGAPGQRGIGLKTVRTLCQRSGADFSIRQRPGGGSVAAILIEA